MNGKDKCEILKKIRFEFAQKNGIDYSPSECNHEGDCNGVCPKCEEEAGMIMENVKNGEIVSIEDGVLISDNISLIYDNYKLIDLVDIEDEPLGGDIMIDDNDYEDIVEITEQGVSLDYLANDENKDGNDENII